MNPSKLTKPITLFLLVILSAFTFAGCGPSGPPSIGEVVTARSLDADYKPINPTTTYLPSDEFQLSVEVKNLTVGSVVNVKYVVDGQPYDESTSRPTSEAAGIMVSA